MTDASERGNDWHRRRTTTLTALPSHSLSRTPPLAQRLFHRKQPDFKDTCAYLKQDMERKLPFQARSRAQEDQKRVPKRNLWNCAAWPARCIFFLSPTSTSSTSSTSTSLSSSESRFSLSPFKKSHGRNERRMHYTTALVFLSPLIYSAYRQFASKLL